MGRGGARLRENMEPCGTPAAACRHRRHGEPLDEACAQAERADQRERRRIAKMPAPPAERNGLPWKPYRYTGTGRDAFDGTCLFDEVT